VPSSAGAHHAGQEQAPRALRQRGLIDELGRAGLTVEDGGDVAGEVFVADAVDASARNVDAVVRVAAAVADAVEEHVRRGVIPLVLGGDCTITVGVVAGLQRVYADVRLAYFDGDADLNQPADTRSGVLDASGISHLLGIADTPLAGLGNRIPLLREHQLALMGYDPADTDSFDAEVLAQRPGLLNFTGTQLRAEGRRAAEAVVAAMSDEQSRLVVHFDVDAVDGRDLPLANFPHYGTGVRLSTAGEILQTLCAAANLSAVVLTEVNPTHDPSGVLLDRYVEEIVRALGSASEQASSPEQPR
jgi:arginase